jgi:hypothetical protein
MVFKPTRSATFTVIVGVEHESREVGEVHNGTRPVDRPEACN